MVCFRCGTLLEKELDPEVTKKYPYYCPNCDENMYSFEVRGKLDKFIEVDFHGRGGQITEIDEQGFAIVYFKDTDEYDAISLEELAEQGNFV